MAVEQAAQAGPAVGVRRAMMCVWMGCLALCIVEAAFIHDAGWATVWGVLALTAHLQRIEDPD